MRCSRSSEVGLIDDPDGHILATFLEDGTYLVALDIDGDATHTGVRGAYTWNSAPGPDYGLITATAQGDTNGDWGIANDVDGPVEIRAVSGDSATVSSPLAADPLAHVHWLPFRTSPGPSLVHGPSRANRWSAGQPFADGTYILGELALG
ncbi:MAG: hypothetical protein R3E33_06130 [Rhodocyclaceae bacterium]